MNQQNEQNTNDQNLPQVLDNQTHTSEMVVSDSQEETPEQIENNQVEEVKKQYKLTPKFNKWCDLFFDKTNKQTYLNRTQSAIQAYSLDPIAQYNAARVIGSQNYAKLNNVASEIAENKGYTMDKWLDVGWLNALKSDSPEWWDRIGDTLGFRSMKPQVQIQNNTQNNTIVNVGEEEQKSFNDQFRNFIKNQ
jgi:hypothetical protein